MQTFVSANTELVKKTDRGSHNVLYTLPIGSYVFSKCPYEHCA